MHAPRRDYKDVLKVHAAPGEPFVWLTSMGLAIGLLMVVGLLGVIVMNGLPVFWPGDAVVAKLKEGVTSPVPNTPEIIGEIAQERTKSVKVLGPDGKPACGPDRNPVLCREQGYLRIQLCLPRFQRASPPSKDRRTSSFSNESSMAIAFGTPVALQLADGQRIDGGCA